MHRLVRRLARRLAAEAVLGLAAARHAHPEALDPFYEPPLPLPPAPPGTLIRAAPMPGPPGVVVRRILYHTIGHAGGDVAVSGLVAAPQGTLPAGGWPLLAVAHGTTGIARHCAPSRHPLTAGGDVARPAFLDLLRPFLDAGYVVAATDYEGLGAPGVHPYLAGETLARNVLDAARAARALPGPPLSEPMLVWGHSEGGLAAAFTAQIAAAYAPELRLAGVVAVAPATEPAALLNAVVTRTEPTEALGLFMLMVYAWRQLDPTLDPAAVLTPAALARLPVAGALCYLPVMVAFADAPPSHYLRVNPTRTSPWRDLLARLTPDGASVTVPVLVVQGGADRLVRPAMTAAYVRRLAARGATVRLKTYAGADHSGVIAPSMPDVLAWMQDRLAGLPVPSPREETPGNGYDGAG